MLPHGKGQLCLSERRETRWRPCGAAQMRRAFAVSAPRAITNCSFVPQRCPLAVASKHALAEWPARKFVLEERGDGENRKTVGAPHAGLRCEASDNFNQKAEAKSRRRKTRKTNSRGVSRTFQNFTLASRILDRPLDSSTVGRWWALQGRCTPTCCWAPGPSSAGTIAASPCFPSRRARVTLTERRCVSARGARIWAGARATCAPAVPAPSLRPTTRD